MYGKWLYKEIGTEYGACMVEIYRKNYTGESIEIGALAADSLSIALENLGSITDPIGKSVCSFSIIDTDQVEYDDFFTPDATALKVVVSTRVGGGAYVTRWSGYVTPDFFAENLSYRTPISISARDNIGYLNDVDFDLTATTITVRGLIQSAFARIAEDYPMSLSFVTQKQTAEGILAIDATISTTLLREMTWGEALETILHDLGLQMRWVDNNTIAVSDLSQIPEYYATQGFNFIGASGYREIVPAWRQLSQEQDYGLKEDFFEGEITSQNVKFVKEETVDYSLPPALDGSPQQVRFKYYQPTNWLSQGEIYTLNPADYNFGTLIQENNNELFKDRIYFTGIAADSTDYANHYIGWRQTVYKSNWPLNIKFKAFNAVMYSSSWLINNLYPIILYESNPNPDSYQVGLKVNILLHTGTLTYILKEDWVLLSGAETDAITFILPEIKWSELGKEEDLTISINQIPYDGELEFRIYGHFKNPKHDSNVAISDEAFTKMVTYIKDVVYTYESSSIPTGQDSGVLVNEQHNIKDDQDYTFGQVPNDCGGINAFVGGLYKANGDELTGFQRNADATNYNLLELVGREIIHFNKKNYNRLSGTIRNLDKEPLMFNRLFVREGKRYAPYNYSLNVISNEMNITSMQEVEPYTTANFSEVHSEVSTGGATVSSGNNQVLQYSAEVGNAKRLYELQTISENEKPDAYVLVDGAGYPEARKLKLTDIAGLDEKALEQYLVQYKYLQEADLTPIIQDFEKLEEAVNPLFGYFDATGNANNALKLGGHSADYFAPAKAVNTLTTDLNSLASRVSINEQGIATNKANIATLVGQVNGLAKDIEILKDYWYIDDDGSLHTTHNIVVDGGGAFGKGSGGGGDVPSGGGIDETQLWNILGTSGTQTIHSSHIPDLSGKYLSVSGGTIENGGPDALIIRRLDGGNPYITFYNNTTFLGRYGFNTSGEPIAIVNSALRTLIHSGNIGDYAMKNASKVSSIDSVNAGEFFYTRYRATGVPATNYAGGFSLQVLKESSEDYRVQLAFGTDYVGYVRGCKNGTYTAWKTIAFTDSNVASATKLQTARTIWGQSFDGSGNVNGTLAFAEDEPSRYITKRINSSAVEMIRFPSASDKVMILNRYGIRDGYGLYTGGSFTVYSKTWGTADFSVINGNVLVGTTTDSGYKLDVNGTFNATTIYQNGTAIGSLAFKNSLVASDIPSLNWSKITSGKPTTLSGYGITDALSTSGGTISGNLTLNATSAAFLQILLNGTSKALVGWQSNHGVRLYNYASASYLSIKDDGTPTYNGNTLIHSGNYSSYALPLSGGTISGATQVYAPLVVNSGQDLGVGFRLQVKGNNKTLLAWDSGYGSYLYNTPSGRYIGILDSGTPYYYNGAGNQTLIHSGNIGSQSVNYASSAGNADTLDSLNSSDFARSRGSDLLLTDINHLGYGGQYNNWPYYGPAIVFGVPKYFARIQKAYDSNRLSVNSYINGVGDTNWQSIAFTSDLANYLPLSGGTLNDSATLTVSKWGKRKTILNGNDIIFDFSNDKGGYFGGLRHITPSGEKRLLEFGTGGDAHIDFDLSIHGAVKAEGSAMFNNSHFGGSGTWGPSLGAMKEGTIGLAVSSSSHGLWAWTNATSGDSYLQVARTDNLTNVYNMLLQPYGGGVLIGNPIYNGNYKLNIDGRVNAEGYRMNNTSYEYCGLMPYNVISSGSDTTGIWLYNTTGLYFYGSTIELMNSVNITGNLTVTGGGSFGSDIRYKDITSDRQLNLETIANAPLFSFRWTDREDKVEHLGTSAQYWLDTQFKDAVNTANKDFYHLDYGALAVGIGISVAKEVKVVKTEVQLLRERVNQLERELAQYRRS